MISDTLDDVLGPELNPLQAPIAELKACAKDLIEEKLHIDVDQLKSFVTSPTHRLGVQSVSLTLPGLGTQQLDLFAPKTHTKLDALMALLLDGDTSPLWESCLLRPTFTTLYRDYENGDSQFPALGDPDAPVATLGLDGNTHASGGVTYVGAEHTFTAGADDAVFTDARTAAQYRITKAQIIPGAWHDIAPDGTFAIPAAGGDGPYDVQLRTADPCHTFDPSDALPAGAPVTRSVVLDTTPPEITITKTAPEGVRFDSDEVSAIEFTVTDAGAGVDAATVQALFGGRQPRQRHRQHADLPAARDVGEPAESSKGPSPPRGPSSTTSSGRSSTRSRPSAARRSTSPPATG